MRTKFSTISLGDSLAGLGDDTDHRIRPITYIAGERICAYPGCDTILRKSNSGVLCSVHRPLFNCYLIDHEAGDRQVAAKTQRVWAKKDARLRGRGVAEAFETKISHGRRPVCDVAYLYKLFTKSFLTKEYHGKNKTPKEIGKKINVLPRLF